MNDYALIAKINSIFNAQGYLKAKPVEGFEKCLFEREFVFVDVFGAPRKFFLEDVFENGEFVAVKFKNFGSSGDVNFLIGKEILLPAEEVKDSEKNVFLLSELTKLTVYRNGKFFGRVKDILNFKANDVLVVQDVKGEEVLIPFVKDFVPNVDLENGRIDLISGEGDLFDVAD